MTAYDWQESQTHEHVEWTTWRGETRSGIVLADYGPDPLYGHLVDIATDDGRIVRKDRGELRTTAEAPR